MPLKVEIVFGEALVADIEALDDEVNKKLLRRIARDVLPPLERRLDRVLSYEPPPRNVGSPKFVWSHNPAANARARRWFFANYPNGYTRTGDMAQAWIASIMLVGGAIELSVENPAPGSSYVYGDDSRSQIPGHRTTGWRQTDVMFQDIGADTEDDVEELWFDMVEKYF